MKNKVTAKMLRRATKILCRKLKVEGEGYVEVKNPKVRTDFLMKTKKNEEMIINKFKRKE